MTYPPLNLHRWNPLIEAAGMEVSLLSMIYGLAYPLPTMLIGSYSKKRSSLQIVFKNITLCTI